MKFTGGGFGGAGGANMQQMMKQAQKLQEQMQKAQEELETDTVTGAAGGGMVNAVMNGHKKLLAVSVKPEAVDPSDVEMLEDLIMAAYNDAFEKAEELCKEKMGPLASLPF